MASLHTRTGPQINIPSSIRFTFVWNSLEICQQIIFTAFETYIIPPHSICWYYIFSFSLDSLISIFAFSPSAIFKPGCVLLSSRSFLPSFQFWKVSNSWRLCPVHVVCRQHFNMSQFSNRNTHMSISKWTCQQFLYITISYDINIFNLGITCLILDCH